jgi:hypothetical protein
MMMKNMLVNVLKGRQNQLHNQNQIVEESKHHAALLMNGFIR